MSARTYECFGCGHIALSAKESMSHATTCPAAGSTITRAVSCWRCAAQIDMRNGRACPSCGWEHPGFNNDAA